MAGTTMTYCPRCRRAVGIGDLIFRSSGTNHHWHRSHYERRRGAGYDKVDPLARDELFLAIVRLGEIVAEAQVAGVGIN